MNKVYSVTLGLSSGHVAFWANHTQVRLLPLNEWHDLDDFEYEDFLGTDACFQFKTTAIWEYEEEVAKEPWQRNDDDEDDDGIMERPCTWTLQMSNVPWVRVIYRVDGEIPTPGH